MNSLTVVMVMVDNRCSSAKKNRGKSANSVNVLGLFSAKIAHVPMRLAFGHTSCDIVGGKKMFFMAIMQKVKPKIYKLYIFRASFKRSKLPKSVKSLKFV